MDGAVATELEVMISPTPQVKPRRLASNTNLLPEVLSQIMLPELLFFVANLQILLSVAAANPKGVDGSWVGIVLGF